MDGKLILLGREAALSINVVNPDIHFDTFWILRSIQLDTPDRENKEQ